MTKNTTDTIINNSATTNVVADNSNTKNKEDKNKKETKAKKKPITRQSVELNGSEEIPVVALIPHVGYLDKRTQDKYEWEEVGHIEYMTVETLTEMWRNNKGYFRNLWLKPLDDRVLIKFGLVKLFEDYEFLMEESSYAKNNLDRIVTAIAKIPVGMKFAVVDKIKQLVIDEKITDVSIIRTLGRKFDVDFLAFI